MRELWDTEAGRAVVVALGAIAVLTALGLAMLWPRGEAPEAQQAPPSETTSGTVQAVIEGGCAQIAGPGCVSLAVRLDSGPEAGRATTVSLPDEASQQDVEVGDEIRLLALDPASGLGLDQTPLGGGEVERSYVFVDFERGTPLTALAILFLGAVVAFGRRRGGLALGGLAASLAVVLLFVVPAMIEGGPPLGVAIVGASAVMLLTIPLTHGLGAHSAAAMLGTGGALVLTALLAALFVELGRITGVVGEEAALLRGAGEGTPPLRGLVLAGAVIGMLGVLGDLAVSQASTVMALRRAHPARSVRRLHAAALTIARERIGARVNALVLAYVGAALPVLVIFSTQDIGLGTALQREAVAEEIVAALVGCIGLVAAVPLTTGLAAALAVRLPATALTDGSPRAARSD